MAGSKRFASRAAREVNRDSFIHEWAEPGLVLFNAPSDPKPQIRVEDRRIVELDGKAEPEFDMLDRFIARYAIDVSIAPGRWRSTHWPSLECSWTSRRRTPRSCESSTVSLRRDSWKW
jgi:propanediol dehydratase large subunit